MLSRRSLIEAGLSLFGTQILPKMEHQKQPNFHKVDIFEIHLASCVKDDPNCIFDYYNYLEIDGIQYFIPLQAGVYDTFISQIKKNPYSSEYNTIIIVRYNGVSNILFGSWDKGIVFSSLVNQFSGSVFTINDQVITIKEKKHAKPLRSS